MKFILFLTALAVVYIFFPTYDLYVVKDPFADDYILQERGIYLENNCQKHAQRLDQASPDPLRYRCRKTSKWTTMYRGYTQYDPSIRDAQRLLQED